jgi:hypothetical protein
MFIRSFFCSCFLLLSFSLRSDSSESSERGFGLPNVSADTITDSKIDEFNSKVYDCGVFVPQGIDVEKFLNMLNSEPTLYEAGNVFRRLLLESDEYLNKLRSFVNGKDTIVLEEFKKFGGLKKETRWKVKKDPSFTEKIVDTSVKTNKEERLNSLILSSINNVGLLNQLNDGVLADYSKNKNVPGIKKLLNYSTSFSNYIGGFLDNPGDIEKKDNEIFPFVKKFSSSKDFDESEGIFLEALRLINSLYERALKINSMLLETMISKSELMSVCVYDSIDGRFRCRNDLLEIFGSISQNSLAKLNEVLGMKDFGAEVSLKGIFLGLKKINISDLELAQLEAALKNFLRFKFNYKDENSVLPESMILKIRNEAKERVKSANFFEKLDFIFDAMFGNSFLNFIDPAGSLCDFFKIFNLIDRFFSYEKINILPSHLKVSAILFKRVIERLKGISPFDMLNKGLIEKKIKNVFNLDSPKNDEFYYKIQRIKEEGRIIETVIRSAFADMGTIIIPASLVKSCASEKQLLQSPYCSVEYDGVKKNFVSYKNLNNPSVDKCVKISHSGNDRSSVEIITGPNNCGKTFGLAQECIGIFLGKIFGFVPAQEFSMSRIGLVMYVPRLGVNNKIIMSTWERERQLALHLSEYVKGLQLGIGCRFYLDEPYSSTSASNAIELLFNTPEFSRLISDKSRVKLSFTTHVSAFVRYFSKLPSYLRTINVVFNRINDGEIAFDQSKVEKKVVSLKGKKFDFEKSKENCVVYVAKKKDDYVLISDDVYKKNKENQDFLNSVVKFSIDVFKKDGDLYHLDLDDDLLVYSEVAPVAIDPAGMFSLFVKFKLVEDQASGSYYFKIDDSYGRNIYKRSDLNVVSNLGEIIPVSEGKFNKPMYMSGNGFVNRMAAMSAKQVLRLTDMNSANIPLLP